MAAIPEYLKFYINGEWVDPVGELKTHEVIDPSTEKPIARIALGSKADVDRAVAAAKAAFPAFAATTPEYRADLLDKIVAEYTKRLPEIAKVISDEMGAPMWLANAAQAPAGLGHFATTAAILRQFKFEEMRGNVLLRKEPAGVCGLITPWNWPANQIACKVAPALAAGCTMVLKPSELAPLDAIIIAECIAAAGVPAGVFNLVNGDGPTVGTALSSSPDIDMMSFTGSTRAGILVAQAAAGTVKRVAQELGGKSANIITPDAPLEKAVTSGVLTMMTNSGQSCNAPSRMLIHKDQYDKAVEIAAAVASTVKVQPPKEAEQGAIGPVANGTQFKKINGLLQKGIDEGAKAVVGGPGRPEGLTSGYYIRPTIFANVNNQMTIAREEIFGPVLVMIPYNNLDEAVEIANDTPCAYAPAYAQDVIS
ncbi:aldehyde dehydrogenase family protein [Hyaloraphidium curvatum]|nr:aldehyde dehydrogenase family protein [Hyaloraphidium curvatum]